MKRKFTNFLLLLALCVVGTSAFVSCKDYESDELGSMKTQIRELIIQQANDVKDMTGDIEDLQKQVGDWDPITNGTITSALNSAKTTADNALSAANNANSRLDQLFGANNDLNGTISNLQCVVDLMNRVQALENAINGDGQTNGISKQLEDLKEQIGNMTEGWTGNIKDVSDDAAKALALAKEDSLRLDAIDQILANITDYSQDIQDIKNQLSLLNGNYNTLKDDVASMKGDINTLKSDVAAAKQDAADAKAEATRLFNEAKTLIETAKQEAIDAAKTYTDNQLTLTKQELENAYKAADAALEQKISALSTELKGLLNQLSDALYKLVTGVIIQGTENPVTGGINTPFDISTNILAAYYGYNKTGVNVLFPIGSKSTMEYGNCYVRPSEAEGFEPLIEAVKIAESGDLMMYENSLTYGGNAGKLYVTVNPSSADMSGLKFNLVDTQDNPAAGYDDFTLAKCNDKQMTFGWTRAAEENGFYVANANVKDPQAAKPDIDLGALKNVAKNVLDKISNPGNTRLDIVDGVTTIYKQINNKLVAYGVKIPGKYTDANGVEHARNIYSQYKLAATAIKPLSYATLKDGLNKSIPMIPTLESKGITINMDDFTWNDIEEMDSIEVEIKLDEYPDIDNIKVNGKVVPEVTVTQPGVTITKKYRRIDGTGGEVTVVPAGEEDQWYLADVEVSISDAEVEVGDIDFSKVDVTIGTKTETLKVKVPMDQFNEIIRDINDQVGGMLGNVTDMVDKVNNAITTVDSYINKVNSFIKKLNNKLRNPNSLLQITMFYETANGSYAQLNAVKSKAMASRMKLGGKSEGAILLIPSSYTAEMFAPALKKYVAVTSAPSAAAQEYANKGLNMNQVIDGRCHNVVFQANQKGLYEIAYSAVDFHGFITTRKFYITVE